MMKLAIMILATAALTNAQTSTEEPAPVRVVVQATFTGNLAETSAQDQGTIVRQVSSQVATAFGVEADSVTTVLTAGTSIMRSFQGSIVATSTLSNPTVVPQEPPTIAVASLGLTAIVSVDVEDPNTGGLTGGPYEGGSGDGDGDRTGGGEAGGSKSMGKGGEAGSKGMGGSEGGSKGMGGSEPGSKGMGGSEGGFKGKGSEAGEAGSKGKGSAMTAGEIASPHQAVVVVVVVVILAPTLTLQPPPSPPGPGFQAATVRSPAAASPGSRPPSSSSLGWGSWPSERRTKPESTR